MIVTTTDAIDGETIEDYLGVVRGVVVHVPTQRQSTRGANAIFEEGYDGRNPYYLEVAEAARAHAYAEMIAHAGQLGADAIIAARYQTTPFRHGIAEVLAYGTAVRLERSRARRAGPSDHDPKTPPL